MSLNSLPMQLSFKDVFAALPGSSRVWVFSSDRPLTEVEGLMAKRALAEFVSRWAAHGKKLSALGDILLDRFVVLSVDESTAGASGCSIDSSVHFLKELGNQLNVDLFNRMKLYVLQGDEIIRIHIADLPTYKDALLFDPLISDLEDFRTNFLIPVESSLLYKQFA
jgi:hypothetical protein